MPTYQCICCNLGCELTQTQQNVLKDNDLPTACPNGKKGWKELVEWVEIL